MDRSPRFAPPSKMRKKRDESEENQGSLGARFVITFLR
jgi:hypothetical protein